MEHVLCVTSRFPSMVKLVAVKAVKLWKHTISVDVVCALAAEMVLKVVHCKHFIFDHVTQGF